MVSNAFFVTINIHDALSLSYGSQVHLIVVVASIGPVTPRCVATREICIKDSRFGFLTIILFVYFSHRQ
jgi:hypothetical protein